jgi:hypothetical protein
MMLHFRHVLAMWGRRFCLALAAILAGAGMARAQTVVDCTSNSGALSNTIFSSGQSYEVQGTCIGHVQVLRGAVLVAIGPAPGGGEIQGTLFVAGAQFSLSNITVDGTGADTSENSGTGILNLADGTSFNNVVVQNFVSGRGVDVDGGNFQMDGGEIIGITDCAIFINSATVVDLSGNVEITGNSLSVDGNAQGGLCVENGGTVKISGANIHGNGGGPAIAAIGGSVIAISGTFSSPANDPTTAKPFTTPAIVVQQGKLTFYGGTVTGGGNASAIYAAPGSSIQMQGATVTDNDANDPTILVANGSALVSLGGNTISNTASGGTAISVTNGSSFQQRLEAALGTYIGNAAQADTITGAGIAEIESSMELGTGASAASTWNGSIDAAQNSSVRMDGGITVNGSVTLAQASNGFFNLGNTGSNVVTGGVLCPFSTNQAAHVTGSAKTVQLSPGGAIAVTFGTAANDCLSF